MAKQSSKEIIVFRIDKNDKAALDQQVAQGRYETLSQCIRKAVKVYLTTESKA